MGSGALDGIGDGQQENVPVHARRFSVGEKARWPHISYCGLRWISLGGAPTTTPVDHTHVGRIHSSHSPQQVSAAWSLASNSEGSAALSLSAHLRKGLGKFSSSEKLYSGAGGVDCGTVTEVFRARTMWEDIDCFT